MGNTNVDDQTFSGISIDLANVVAKAEEMREAAKSLKEESENIKKEWYAARPWEGPAAEQFRAKLIRLSARLDSEADSLIKTAESLEKAAERFRKIEEMAKLVFKGGGQ